MPVLLGRLGADQCSTHNQKPNWQVWFAELLAWVTTFYAAGDLKCTLQKLDMMALRGRV